MSFPRNPSAEPSHGTLPPPALGIWPWTSPCQKSSCHLVQLWHCICLPYPSSMEASLLSPPDPSKRRSTVSEWSADADAESHRSWTRNHDDEFQLNLLRPWSITSHPSVRSRSSTVTDTQYASASAVDPDDASTKGLLSSGTWARFGRRSRDAADDVDSPGAQFAYGGPGWWKHQMLSDRSFRTMAAVTTIFAFIMSVICIAYLKDLTHRPNKNSTSVGGKA